MDAVHSSYSAIFDAPKTRKLKSSFWLGLAVAAILHGAIAAYLIQQRFAIFIPPAETETIPDVFLENMPKKEEPPKPIKTDMPPPPTALTPRESEAPIPATVETTPIAPSKEAADPGPPVPPVIADAPSSGPATQPAPPAYVAARWTRFPDSEALMSYYPARAETDEVEGQASLECVVADAKGRVSCSVLSETPKGYDFGKATVAMVQREGRVDTSRGDVRIGSRLKTVVKWTLN